MTAEDRALPGVAWTKLSLLCRKPIIYGILQPGPDQASGVPYVRPSEIVNDEINLAEVRRTSAEIAQRYQRSTLEAEDVLLSIVGTIGKVAIVPEALAGANITQSSVRVSPEKSIVQPAYLAWFLRSPLAVRQYNLLRLGTGVPRLNVGDVREIEAPLRSIAEQRRIVEKIEALTARSRRARAALEALPGLLERYRASVLAAAFRGDLTKDWRTDEANVPENDAAAGNPHRIPPGWEWKKLPSLGELNRGKSKHRPRNDPSLFGGPYPFFQTGEVTAADGPLIVSKTSYNEKGLAQSRLWPAGTVCITIAANIAETAVLAVDGCFPDSVVGFVADRDAVLPEYVEFFMRTAKGSLQQYAPATAQKNINLKVLNEVLVPVAPSAEQQEIVRRINVALEWSYALARGVRSATDRLSTLDQSILAKAFRGELVPQDPTDEPASALLDRIRARRAAEGPAPKRGRRKTA